MDYFNLKAERKRLKLTLRDMSNAAYIPLRRYREIEAGKVKPDVHEKRSIERAIENEDIKAARRLALWNKLVTGE